jgi:hypothetical protein
MQKCSVVVYLALCFRQAGVIEPMCQLTEKAWRYSPRSATPHLSRDSHATGNGSHGSVDKIRPTN